VTVPLGIVVVVVEWTVELLVRDGAVVDDEVETVSSPPAQAMGIAAAAPMMTTRTRGAAIRRQKKGPRPVLGRRCSFRRSGDCNYSVTALPASSVSRQAEGTGREPGGQQAGGLAAVSRGRRPGGALSAATWRRLGDESAGCAAQAVPGVRIPPLRSFAGDELLQCLLIAASISGGTVIHRLGSSHRFTLRSRPSRGQGHR
jgi:hypothetical protein